MAGKKGMKQYPIAFRAMVVQDYFDSGLGYRSLAAKYDIRWERVRCWVNLFKKTGTVKSFKMQLKRPPKPKTLEDELRLLKIENELLKKFHEELRR